MKKHSFQKGDRVVGLGVKGVYERPYGDNNDNEHLIRRDAGRAASQEPFWWYDGTDLQHDRDFQAGDWVRYEPRVPEDRYGAIDADYVAGPLTIEKIREDGGYEILAHDREGRLSRACKPDNLIKITPPTKEKINKTNTVIIENLLTDFIKIMQQEKVDKADTAIIEHDRWGRVEGVERDTLGAPWAKNGACYYPGDGWREVRPKRWVSVDVAFHINEREVRLLDGSDIRFIVPHGYRWKTVEIEKEVE